jgi:hypothetical protein
MLASTPPIDISYIADALVQIDGCLHVARVSPDRGEQDNALIMAGREGCQALTRLRDDKQVWLRLRDLHAQVEQWQRLQVPIVADLLAALGHGRVASETLVATADELLQEAAGFPARWREDPITQAQELVEELQVLTCALAASADRKPWWMGVARAPLKLLGGVLLGVVAAEADAGLREVAPHALHLIDELTEHLGHAWQSLSLGALVTGTRLARQDLTASSQPNARPGVGDRDRDDAPVTRVPIGLEYERPANGQGREQARDPGLDRDLGLER